MPFHKRYEKKARKRYGQYKKCAGYVATDAAKALSMAKYLKSIINVEFKSHTVSGTATAITVAPIIIETTNIAVGDTTFTRDGANAKIVSLSLKYILTQHASAVNTQVRCMLVHDRQTNQAIYSASELLSDVTASDNIASPRNLNHGARFQVLYDKVHTFSDSGRTNSYSQYYRKLQQKIRWDASTPDITDLTMSSYSFVFMSNEPTNTPSITFSHRLRFVDN